MRLMIAAMMALVVVPASSVRGDDIVPSIILPAVNHNAASKVETRQYVVQCQLISGQGTPDEKTFSTAQMVTVEGQSATVAMYSQRPFVTGVQETRDGAMKPIVTVLEEGTEIAVVLTSLDSGLVHLDATITQQSIENAKEIEMPTGEGEGETATLQIAESIIHARRLVRTVSLSETVNLVCDSADGGANFVARFTINEINSSEAAITPIAATESDTAPDEAGPMYLVVYSVGDLLEPHAIAKQDSDLEDVDFVPIIDTVLREALVEWSDDAMIRPVPADRAIVVSQTQKGHKEIASTLRDQRDHVADVRKLLRR